MLDIRVACGGMRNHEDDGELVTSGMIYSDGNFESV